VQLPLAPELGGGVAGVEAGADVVGSGWEGEADGEAPGDEADADGEDAGDEADEADDDGDDDGEECPVVGAAGPVPVMVCSIIAECLPLEAACLGT
jgi:hypothetical protein